MGVEYRSISLVLVTADGPALVVLVSTIRRSDATTVRNEGISLAIAPNSHPGIGAISAGMYTCTLYGLIVLHYSVVHLESKLEGSG